MKLLISSVIFTICMHTCIADSRMWTWGAFAGKTVCPENQVSCRFSIGLDCSDFMGKVLNMWTPCRFRKQLLNRCAASIGAPYSYTLGSYLCLYMPPVDNGGSGGSASGSLGGAGGRGGRGGMPQGSYVFDIPHLEEVGYFKKIGEEKTKKMIECILKGNGFLLNSYTIDTTRNNWNHVRQLLEEANMQLNHMGTSRYQIWEPRYDFAARADHYANEHPKFDLKKFIRYSCQTITKKNRSRIFKQQKMKKDVHVDQKTDKINSLFAYPEPLNIETYHKFLPSRSEKYVTFDMHNDKASTLFSNPEPITRKSYHHLLSSYKKKNAHDAVKSNQINSFFTYAEAPSMQTYHSFKSTNKDENLPTHIKTDEINSLFTFTELPSIETYHTFTHKSSDVEKNVESDIKPDKTNSLFTYPELPSIETYHMFTHKRSNAEKNVESNVKPDKTNSFFAYSELPSMGAYHIFAAKSSGVRNDARSDAKKDAKSNAEAIQHSDEKTADINFLFANPELPTIKSYHVFISKLSNKAQNMKKVMEGDKTSDVKEDVKPEMKKDTESDVGKNRKSDAKSDDINSLFANPEPLNIDNYHRGT